MFRPCAVVVAADVVVVVVAVAVVVVVVVVVAVVVVVVVPTLGQGNWWAKVYFVGRAVVFDDFCVFFCHCFGACFIFDILAMFWHTCLLLFFRWWLFFLFFLATKSRMSSFLR